MNNRRNVKLLNNLLRSQERKKYYSANTNKMINTYKCREHNEYFSKICLECYLDICSKCEKNYHYNHEIVKYDDINPDMSEIESLKSNINIYIDKYNNLKKDINNWYTELKNKIYDFNKSIKHNEVINSIDFLTNYSKNKICLNTIFRFRKIYYNIMEENNIKNKNIISILNKNRNIENIKLPTYYDFFEIKNLLHKLNYNKDNLLKKSELLLDYLLSIPYIDDNNSISNINYNIDNNEDVLSKSSTNFNLFKNPFYFNSNQIKLSESLGDKSTAVKNFDINNDNYYSEKRKIDSKEEEFKNILNKTKISEFNLNSQTGQSGKINKTFNVGEKNVKYFTKIGLLKENDLYKENSSQNLFNKSICSIKSTKYSPNRSYSSYNFNEKKNSKNIFGTKSSLFSNKYENKSINNVNKEENNKKVLITNNVILNNKNAQTKTYIHKKFNNITNYNINKINGNNKKNNYNIKLQKKIIIINKSNRHSNILSHMQKKESKKEIYNNNENLNINNNEIQKHHKFNNYSNIMKQKILRMKQPNDQFLRDKEKSENIYSSPIRPEIFKNTIINDSKKNLINNYDNVNESNNINTNEKKNLFHIINSPSVNKDQSINKENDNNIKYQTYRINNSTNININPPNIIKTNKNSPFFVDPDKEICIGVELGNSECKVGIVNQNTSEIQLVCFEEAKYSIPTLISFGDNKKEIKIGYKAEENILNNPNQTIFNIVKYFGKKFNDIKGRKELWPFKIYYTKDDENKPYIKINYGPQKDKVFYFENILSIFLEKMFGIVFNKVNLENSSNYNTQEKIKGKGDEEHIKNKPILNIILVLTVPNYFSYYQRKLIEKIFKNEIFPGINDNESLKIYGQYKINLIGLKIENASSIASLCLNMNYDINLNKNKKNILILNIDGGSTNISITSAINKNDKLIYQVRVVNGLLRGETDVIDDFMYLVLEKLKKNEKKEILDSSLALAKLRKICEKIRINLLKKESDSFNIKEILDNYDYEILIKRKDYENSCCDLFNNIKSLINDSIKESQLKERNIKDIILIGEFSREKKITQMIEQLFGGKNNAYEDLFYSNHIDKEKDFYLVGGAGYHAINYANNNVYSFNDISPFSIGIENYNGNLDYIIIKGEKIPSKNRQIIRINNDKELKIFEKDDNKDKNNKLIGIVKIEDDAEIDMDNIMDGYKEIKIEYEINDKLELIIKIFNGEKYGNEIKVGLIYDNYIK